MCRRRRPLRYKLLILQQNGFHCHSAFIFSHVMKTYLLIFSVIMIFSAVNCGCQQNGVAEVFCDSSLVTYEFSTIIESDTISLDDLIDTVGVIKLETTTESLLSKIRQIVIGNDYIYVLDYLSGGGVAIFDRISGSFVRRLSVGNGPADIYVPQSISFNRNTDELVVGMWQIVKVFSSNGEYIRSFTLPFMIQDILCCDGGYLLSQLPSQNSRNRFSVIHTDSVFNIKKVFFSTANVAECITSYPFCHLADGSFIICQPFNYLLFSYDYETFKPAIALDLGERQFLTDNLLDYQEFFSKFKDTDVAFFGVFSEIFNYQYFSFETGDTKMIDVYYNKPSGQMRCGYKLTDILSDNLICCSQFAGAYNNCFVGYFSWDSFSPDCDKSTLFVNTGNLTQDVVDKVKSLKEDDNPLIILYRLKDIPADTE